MRYGLDLITNCTLIFGMGALLFHLMALSYLTALSFSTVINIPDWGSLLLLNTVGNDSIPCSLAEYKRDTLSYTVFESFKAVIYTLSGGMKTVIWTDSLQSFVMIFSLLFLSKFILFDFYYLQLKCISMKQFNYGHNYQRKRFSKSPMHQTIIKCLISM